MGLAAVALIHRERLVGLCWVAIAASGGAMTTWSLLVAADPPWQVAEDLMRWAMTCSGVCVVTVYTGGFLALRTRSAGLRSARWVFVGLTWLFVAATLAGLWLAQPLTKAVPERVLLGLGFAIGGTGAAGLAGSAVVRMLILLTAMRQRARHESLADRIQLELECPRCGAELSVPAGPARCPSCRFTMMIEVEEPRCECGYLLYDLAGDQCPECGRAVVPWIGQAE
jgi:hypothetical protein